MPRLVEHKQKRREIIEATWRLIASQGFEGATMRDIAAEAGYANGALTHYFRNKNELLEAAFLFVWESTNERIFARLANKTGLDAIRVYCEEIAPTNEITVLEARIVLSFFPQAIRNPRMAQIAEETFTQWRQELTTHLEQARAAGTLSSPVPDETLVDQVLSMLMGLQILAVITPLDNDSPRQIAQIEAFITSLMPQMQRKPAKTTQRGSLQSGSAAIRRR